MSQIIKIDLDLGVPAIRSDVNLETIPLIDTSEFGFEPGWYTLDRVENYLTSDFWNIFDGLLYKPWTSLHKFSPAFQGALSYQPHVDETIMLFTLSGEMLTQVYDLTGYNTVAPTNNPYLQSTFTLEFFLKPGTTDATNVLSYLKPGDIGIDGSPVIPVETSSYTSVMISGKTPSSFKNVSATTDCYVLLVTVPIWSDTYDYMAPYVIPFS